MFVFIQDLMAHCSNYLKRKLTRNNCVQTLICADTHADSSLKDAAMDFILENSCILTSKFVQSNVVLSRHWTVNYQGSKEIRHVFPQ